ncbi:hypothetical protein DL766_001646 [Monosporascus sp. MC13-8B]|uniref:Uncharacterized protein n=1 Tax=Monosporascus cannonballus TaxID=155416 RepID=A0ABY0H469_9PEZI|nr:hypothetical protein DL762_005659 [Monosporascus cannonballus]RYP37072.1 hypothetical protein DL766_001646 [Monosporascus sp. MC13-8B]
MAASAGLPLSFHYDEDHSVLLSDSEDDEMPTASRDLPRYGGEGEAGDLQKKAEEAAANVPLHPIPAMQPAFAESLMEATNNFAVSKPKLRFGDAKERRTRLLEGSKDAGLHAEFWRYRPGQRHHELWKLMAQISFGVYLLLNGIANSNEQVVAILQGHIDEVDEFLETTMEDISLAIDDVKERTDLLRVPMANIATFEEMLEDRNFRLEIVTGNEKIEHITSRSRTALEASIEDIDEGLKATKEFAVYLGGQRDRPWRQKRPDVIEIFDAMKGNAEGWWKAFADLRASASHLDTLLIALGQIVAEMNLRAGEVSRRTRVGVTGSRAAGATEADSLQFSVAPFSDPTGGSSGSRSAPPLRRGTADVRSARSNTVSSQQSYDSARESLPFFLVPSLDKRAVDSEADYQEVPQVKLGQIVEAGHEEEEQTHDEGLFILQPRTYTPQPPAPLPSPMVHDSDSEEEVEEVPKRTSLRQRVSLKGGNPPERIQVPTRDETQILRPAIYQAPSSAHGHDSAYGSGTETRPPLPSFAGRYADLPPPSIPNTIPSPRSDQQYFRPVQASPHSPLQQRPWTSGTTAHPHPGLYASHTRNQPSRMGMSTLSNVTTASQAEKKVKKKRSAFGWLKKAFTLDDEERAEFEARKHQQAHNPYYESRSPKYLDGKRREEYRRY